MDIDLSSFSHDIDAFGWWLFDGCSHQKRTRRHLGVCLQARLHEGRRKTHQPAGMRLADSAADGDALRQRINRAYLNSWSDDLVRRRLQALAEQAVPNAVALVVDDTGIEKDGSKSPGVQRQYTGTAGKITNCQVVVSTHLVSHRASVALEMDLYLPESWTADRERRKEAWIPDDVVFRTKPQIALDQIRRVHAAGDVPKLVLADPAYGDNTEFRRGLDDLQLRYIVGVSSTTKVWRRGEGPDPPKPYSGRGRRPTRRLPGTHQPVEVRELAEELGEDEWVEVDLRPDEDRKRKSRFAQVRVRGAKQAVQGKPPGPEQWLLIEWPEDEESPTHYWLSNLQPDIDIETLAVLAKLRWRVEQDYREMKQEAGLEHYEGRRWVGFQHHLTICMAAMTWLVACRGLFPPRTSTLAP